MDVDSNTSTNQTNLDLSSIDFIKGRTRIRVARNLAPNDFDFAYAPCDSEGSIGRLNRFVLSSCGYTAESALEHVVELKRNGFALISRGDNPNIVLVVTIGARQTRMLLGQNLMKSIVALSARIAGKSVWIPLMGTGAGGLSEEESLAIILNALFARISIFQEIDTAPSIVAFAIPDNYNLSRAIRQVSAVALKQGFLEKSTDSVPHKPPAKKRAKKASSAAKQSPNHEDTPKLADAPIQPKHERFGSTPAISDEPAQKDLLGRNVLTKALAIMFAAKEQATPFTMALLGDWGAGKSSVMEQLKLELLAEDCGYPCSFAFVHFDAWQYEDTENIRAGLAHEVIEGLVNEERWWSRRKRNLENTLSLNSKAPKLRIQRFGLSAWGGIAATCDRFWLRLRFALGENRWKFIGGVAKIFAILALGATGIWWATEYKKWGVENWALPLINTGIAAGMLVFVRHVWGEIKPILEHPIASELMTYLKLPDYGIHLGMVPVMKKHIRALCELRNIKKNGDKRLVVFIDNLDRCASKCIVETLDAARLVMDIPNTIVVIAIDHRIALNAVAAHYKGVADKKRDEHAIARDYLGKIIQLCVRLEEPGENEMQRFIAERLFTAVNQAEVRKLRSDSRYQTTFEKIGTYFADRKENNNKHASEKPTDTSRTGVSLFHSEVFTAGQVEVVRRSFEIMKETADDQLCFERWARAFNFTNPRQLLRLRNTYRLLLQLNGVHKRDEN